MRPDFSANARHRGANLTSNKNAWLDEAACLDKRPIFDAADHELSYRGSTNARSTTNIAAAKATCHACPVAAQCLDLAMTRELPGKNSRASIYGGLTPNERQGLAERDKTKNDESPDHGYCPTCETLKPLDQFREYPRRRDCRTCMADKQRLRNAVRLNKPEHRESNRLRAATHRAKKKAAA